MEQKWKIEIGEFRPAYDVYNRGQLELCIVRIDPANKSLTADTEAQPDGTTFRLYNGQEYEAIFESGDGYYPTQQGVEGYLATEEAVSLLDRIYEGYSERWNGQNIVGNLDEDASEAWEMLINCLSSLCTTVKTAVTAEEVFDECREECLTFTSREEIEAFCESLEADGYYLESVGDLWELIQKAKEDMQEEE